MSAETGGGRDFLSNLGKIYGIYTGGFAAFVILLGILEQVGVPERIIGFLFVALTLAIYAGIGILTRTMQVSEYYVAGRSVPAFYNGMATAADWMSGASFLAMAGTLYALGYDGLAFVLGWTGGYILVAVLIAPYLRKFGAYTVPDFLAARYGGNFARLLGIVVLMAASFVYVVAQIRGTGLIAERFLGIPYDVGVFVGIAGILLCSMLGGMRAVTWTQVAQYIVLIIAYLIPVIIMSAQRTGVPIPQVMYGEALQAITQLEQTKPALEGAKPHLTPYSTYAQFDFFALIFCLMVGTASLPHVLMRYFTTPSVREARQSVGWSLLFIFLLYFTAPAYAAFVKWEIYENVIGQPLTSLPDWVYVWGENARVNICGVAAASLEAIQTACSTAVEGGTDIVLRDQFSITRDVVVIATPEIAGLPFVITGLVGAGGLAAALSTADGLLLAMANALSHDIYYKMLDPNAPTKRRLVVARIILFGVAIAGALTATIAPPDILKLVAWAFSLAAAGNFPALMLGIWWKRCNTPGAIAGIMAGFGATLAYLIWTAAPPLGLGNPEIMSVANISAAVFGLPIGFVVMIVVSLITPAPSKEMQDMVDEVRRPRGGVVQAEKT